MEWFNKEYDNLIRETYCHLLGVHHKHRSCSWRIQKLPYPAGGIMLCTARGLGTTNNEQSLASVSDGRSSETAKAHRG
eukprot:TRINITY_DN7081_c0_g1_i1.p1 TRINITY_DN7081_c0_g1~~TRINITY_DN7081_c0_g1_i1.p1  ORF type:complete len:78 (+),score=20.37 TRINITY_DN7081_c0_g1_i1:196-429(+)